MIHPTQTSVPSDESPECDSELGSGRLETNYGTTETSLNVISCQLKIIGLDMDLSKKTCICQKKMDYSVDEIPDIKQNLLRTVTDMKDTLDKFRKLVICFDRDTSRGLISLLDRMMEILINAREETSPQEAVQEIQDMKEKLTKLVASFRVLENRKKQIPTEQTFVIVQCLENLSEEIKYISRNRYKKWMSQNPSGIRAAILFHCTKVEKQAILFQRAIIDQVLRTEETEKIDKKEESEHWIVCDKNTMFHDKNLAKSLEEVDTRAGNMKIIMESEEEFTSKKQKLNSELVFSLFLMFSARNSYEELVASGQREKEDCFEKFHDVVINWMFLFLVSLEEHKESLPSSLESQFLSCLACFRSLLDKWLPNEIDEYDLCD